MPTKRPPGPFTDPPRPSSPTVELRSGAARAAIATRGAEPVAWSADGTELLWDGDPTWWPKSAPVLFPICAHTRFGAVRVGGVSYPMPLHGFAPTTQFAVMDQAEDSVRMGIAANAETRAAYPFDFALTAEYKLAADRLTAVFEVHNRDKVPLPYAIGFHPGFNWPFAGGDRHGHAIVFDKAENPLVPVVSPAGLITRGRHAVPLAGRRLPLGDGVIAGKPLCFFDAASRSLRFENAAGGAIVVATENFPHFAIWAKAGAPYLCIESWTGHADPDDFDGELVDKPSMRLLPAGARARHTVSLSYEAG